MILKQADGQDVECEDINDADRVQDRIAEQLARLQQAMLGDPLAAKVHHKNARAVIDIYNRNEATIARFAEQQDIQAVTAALGKFLDERSKR